MNKQQKYDKSERFEWRLPVNQACPDTLDLDCNGCFFLRFVEAEYKGDALITEECFDCLLTKEIAEEYDLDRDLCDSGFVVKENADWKRREKKRAKNAKEKLK